MESHVRGGSTPLSVGDLRRDLLAVLIGNHLFTKAEQLLANHQAHECECPKRLALWLYNVQREAARRHQVNEAQRQACQQVCDYLKENQAKELRQLAQCRALTGPERRSIPLLPNLRELSNTAALGLVGGYYVKILRRAGKLPEYGA